MNAGKVVNNLNAGLVAVQVNAGKFALPAFRSNLNAGNVVNKFQVFFVTEVSGSATPSTTRAVSANLKRTVTSPSPAFPDAIVEKPEPVRVTVV